MRLCLALLLACGSREGAVISGKISAPEGSDQKKLRMKLYAGGMPAGHKDPDPSPAVVWLEGPSPLAMPPQTVTVTQEGLEFRPRVVAIPVGSTVVFPNGDDLFHNVFSYSKAHRFDLGRYPKGKSKSETFELKGLIDLRCEVHNHMRGYIHVFDHPYFTLAGPDGSYVLPKVPPGKYTLVAQKEFFDPVRKEIEVASSGVNVDVTLALSREVPAGRILDTACCDAR
jgi:plastocyanin